MNAVDGTLLAAAAIVQGFAKGVAPSPTSSFSHLPDCDDRDALAINLPGADSVGKTTLEKELTALALRINTMQAFLVNL